MTVPAYFDDNQRAATKGACSIAGLEVRRLANEPSAASLAYGLDRLGEELRIAVVDLGGTDLDSALFEFLADRFHEHSGIDVRGDAMAAARLREAAEVAKVELSSSTTARLSLRSWPAVPGRPGQAAEAVGARRAARMPGSGRGHTGAPPVQR